MKDKIAETIDTYDKIVEEYTDYYNSKDLNGNVQFQKEIDILIDNLEYDSKILDVGTAIGDYPKYLTEKCDKNFKVVGIDSSSNMIKVAIEKAPQANFKVMDMRYLDFPNNSFDAVICLATLIHVDDNFCLDILQKFNLILKSKGIMIINVMEHIKGDKEIYINEPFNPKYKIYYNTYSKSFFIDWFNNNNYEIMNIIDNPIFNSKKAKGLKADTNQFSIIARKKDDLY